MKYYRLDMQIGFAGEKSCGRCPFGAEQSYQTSYADKDGNVRICEPVRHFTCGIPFPSHIIETCPLVPVKESIFSRLRAWWRKRKEQRKGLMQI